MAASGLEAHKARVEWGDKQADSLWKGLYSRYRLPIDGSVVLDLGCSWGYMLKFLSERFEPAKLIGTDIAPLWDEIDHGWDHRSELFEFHSGRLCDTDAIEPGSVDFVLCTSVLQYMRPEEVVDTLEKVYDVLRPGGEMILRTRTFASYIGADLHSRYHLECPHLRYPLRSFRNDLRAQSTTRRYLNYLLASNYVACFFQSGLEPLDIRRRSDRRSEETKQALESAYPFIAPDELHCAEVEARLLRPIQIDELGRFGANRKAGNLSKLALSDLSPCCS